MPGRRAARAAAGEAVEQARLLAGREPRPLVEHGEPGLVAVAAPVELDARRRVAQRVLDQVVEQDREVLLRGRDRRVAAADQLELAAVLLRGGRPALVGPLGRARERDRPRRRRLVALARERQQRGQQPREPLDLELGRLELRLGVAARLGARRLEPQAQPGQRRAQLVRGVGDELALCREHGPEPLGHVVEGRRDLALLRRAGHLGARLEVAALDPPRRGGEVAQRPRERARQEPGERQPEDEREGADRDQREHAAADAVVHRGEILRDAHRADDAAVVRHRHRRVEQVLAERVAVALALGAQTPRSAVPQLRPRRPSRTAAAA